MDLGTSFTLLVALFAVLVIATYFLPTIVATIRNHPNALSICLLNFFLGWTVIGWFLALFWALAATNSPHVIVIENGRVVRS